MIDSVSFRAPRSRVCLHERSEYLLSFAFSLSVFSLGVAIPLLLDLDLC